MAGGTPSQDERLARVVLSRAAEPGDLTVASLLAQMSAPEVVRIQRDPKPDSELHARIAQVDPERELAQADKQGIRFVIPQDPDWPSQLGDLAHGGVEWLGMGGPPVGLWVRGPLPLERLQGSIAVVGSRSATSYGVNSAIDMAADIANDNRVVVSGAAFGIDEAAHRGAVAAGGATVAVLACGVDRAYPAAHKELLAHLGSHCAVISESPPGSSPTRLRFLTRNRLIAALTNGTVLVEAALRSGALNTAHWAQELSRVVMGVPGPITASQSEGVHHWIRNGGATLVTSGAHVLEMVSTSGEHLSATPRAPESERDRLTFTDQMVLEAVPLTQAADVVSIARVLGRHVRDTDNALRRLNQAGFVTMVEQRWRQVVAAKSP